MDEKNNLKETEISRLKSILSLPQETLMDLGLTAEDLVLIQDKLQAIERDLLKLEEYKEDNKIEFFSPNPPQLEFLINYLNPIYRTFTYTGGNRRGKTAILTIKEESELFGFFPFVWECKDNTGKVLVSWEEVYERIKEWEGITFFVKEDDNGRPLIHLIFSHSRPRKIRKIGQGWEDHIKEVVVPELYKWWPASRPKTIKKNIIGIEVWWIDNETGSELRIMSNDQPTRKFEGWNGDVIDYDEPCKRDVYVANARGLIDRDGKECFAMTLLGEAWIDREIIKKRLPNGKPHPQVYNNHGDSYDNVGFGLRDKKSIETFADKLNPEERKARIEGIPSYLSGVIFGRFKRETHVRERFPVPLDWPVDIAIDFHPKVEQAVLFQATDPLNFKYLVDEIWEFGSYNEIGNEILRKIKRNCYRVNRILIDPATKGQGENVSIEKSVFEKFEDFFRMHGYSLETGSKRRSDGIILCKDRLYGPNREPSVRIFSDLVRFIYEIEGWMYKDGKPVDADDHQMENWGRLELLDTKYTEPQEDNEEYDARKYSGNSIGGY